MPTITFYKANSKEYSRDGMDVDSIVESIEEVAFEITFEQMAEYFAPRGYRLWPKEKQNGFIEGIKEIYYMDLLDDAIHDDDFTAWAYENFYTHN
jgi:hypothetical protein